MANHNISNPVYHSDLRKYEVTDRGHADVFNANENVLINNDVYLKKEIDTIKTSNTSSDKKLDTHTKDTTAHITAAERQTWNAKASTALATTSANGLMSSSDKSTLNNLSTTISNSISGNKVLAEIKKVDGSGSGLDADLLDGKEASAFALSNHSHNNATTSANGFMSASDKTTLNNVNTNLSSHIDNNTVHITAAERTTWNAKASTSIATTSTNGLMSAQQVKDLNSVKSAMSSDNLNSTINNTVTSASTINNIFTKIKEVDGAGSKLDADLLDGKEASAFALSNHTHNNATITSNGLMSKEDKTALNNAISHLSDTTKHIIGYGNNSYGIGNDNTLTNSSCSYVAGNHNNLDSLQYTYIIGEHNIAKSNSLYAYAIGHKNTINHMDAYAIGDYNTITSMRSYAIGSNNRCSYSETYAIGINNIVGNDNAYAIGHGIINNIPYSIVMGKYNKELSDDDLFAIGNGRFDTSSSRSNAFRITTSGQVYGQAAFNSTGADYSEFFEWLDGNINNEDRVGLFVTFDEDKIRIANSNDEYVLGIISGNPSIIGNSHNDDWQGKYLRDEFDRIIYEDVEMPDRYRTIKHNAEYETVIDTETGKEKEILVKEAYEEKILIRKAHTERQPKLNPDYTPSQEFVGREKRPEWDTVGMLGVLSVYDDGTCKANGYCKVADGGIATASETGYRVLKRVNDKIVKILFR